MRDNKINKIDGCGQKRVDVLLKRRFEVHYCGNTVTERYLFKCPVYSCCCTGKNENNDSTIANP